MSYTDYKKTIVQFIKENKRVPGYAEIMSLLGFKSKNAVFKLINKLVDDGVFEKDSRGKLSARNLFGNLSILGVVEAGMPTVADEVSLDTTSLDELLLGDKDQMFMLEVKGESMIEALIQEGDMVLVQRTEKARENDIVIAEVDGGWTMKYLKYKNSKPYLMPANKSFKPIYPEYDLRIAGVVKAVIRKMR